MAQPPLSNEDRRLGLDRSITRKDFLGATLLGVGSTLLGAPSPAAWLDRVVRTGRAPVAAPQDPWTGYGGVGDYAASNGNTMPVLEAAHRLRDGAHADIAASAVDTGEMYDLVVVGGGISGLTAAWAFARERGGRGRCLVLENHPIFGGEAKQNEFEVDGVRLVAPQGSNQFGAPRAGSESLANEVWTDLDLPRSFEYADLDPAVEPLRIPLDNYAHMEGVSETQVDVGYFFDGAGWIRNIWEDQLARAPFDDAVKRDLLHWRTTGPPESSQEFRRSLDALSYGAYIERTMGLRPEVTRMAAPVIGLINGASPDAVSAAAAAQIGMPGVSRPRSGRGSLPQSFPGGNATLARHMVKRLVPAAIGGTASFDGVFDGRVDFAALDRAGQPTRIRVGATVLHVAHENGGRSVVVHYERDGRVERVRATAVVMASGGWMNKHVLADMPADMRAAYDAFVYAPALVVNVALTNWRFLHRLRIAAARWFDDGFGFSCNIRRPMRVGAGPHVPMHPDRPTVLTFYMGLYTPGRSAAEQGVLGRTTLLATPYADYERRIRSHLTRLFADAGFDARRDVAGIILNRWGHARLVQPPGFRYGTDDRPAPLEVVARGYGRIAIGHSELNGHQSMTGAMAQGRRAALQASAL
jgi:spermidine dehydrogenase